MRHFITELLRIRKKSRCETSIFFSHLFYRNNPRISVASLLTGRNNSKGFWFPLTISDRTPEDGCASIKPASADASAKTYTFAYITRRVAGLPLLEYAGRELKPLLTPGIKIIFIIPKPGHTFFGAGRHRQRVFFSGALILAHQKNSGVMRFRIVLRIA